jgi:transposase
MRSCMWPNKGCKWRGLPSRLGNWHTIYTRMNRWSKAGVLNRIFARLQQEQIIQLKIEAVSLDSTIVKVHPDGTGALKKTDRKPSASRTEAGPPRFIWLPQMLDAPEARALLLAMGPAPAGCHLIMDRAYEGDAMRQLALDLGFVPVVPPRTSRLMPWNYNRMLYRRRNEIERLFRRLKGFRRIFSRFDKLDVMFTNFILFTLIVEALR